MYCQVLCTTDEGQVLAGTLRVEGGKIIIDANNGYEQLMQGMAEDHPCIAEDGETLVRSEDDPERWLKLLPLNLSGSMVRARGVEADIQGDWPGFEKGRVFSVYKDGKEIGRIEDGDIETEDGRLEETFYELADDGVPVPVKQRGFVRMVPLTEELLKAELKGFGYDVRAECMVTKSSTMNEAAEERLIHWVKTGEPLGDFGHGVQFLHDELNRECVVAFLEGFNWRDGHSATVLLGDHPAAITANRWSEIVESTREAVLVFLSKEDNLNTEFRHGSIRIIING